MSISSDDSMVSPVNPDLLALEHLEFKTRGMKLHAVAAGPVEGPVVVLLHGFPEFWKGWARQIGPLAMAGYRVIVPDQRGYNLSDKPAKVADYRMELLAHDVLGILDHLGIQQACVAGHDFGATVTWQLLAVYPERIKAAAILNVPHPLVMQRRLTSSFTQLRRSWYMFFFQLPILPERWLRSGDFSAAVRMLETANPGTFSPEDLHDYKRAWSAPGTLRSMIQWYRAAFRFGLPRETPTGWRALAPVLILWGEADAFLGPEMAQESLRFCKNGKCLMFQGVSHWIQHEVPQRVAEELIRHFGASQEPVRR